MITFAVLFRFAVLQGGNMKKKTNIPEVLGLKLMILTTSRKCDCTINISPIHLEVKNRNKGKGYKMSNVQSHLNHVYHKLYNYSQGHETGYF